MIDFLKKTDRFQKIEKELDGELEPKQRASFDEILKYLHKWESGELTPEETYSKIPYCYRYILDVLDNNKIKEIIEWYNFREIFAANIEKAMQDINRQSF